MNNFGQSIKNIAKISPFIRKKGKLWFLLSLIQAAYNGVTPFVSALLYGAMINHLIHYFQDRESGVYQVFYLLILQLCLAQFSYLIRMFQAYFMKKFEFDLDHDLKFLTNQKVAKSPLSYFDIPEFYNQLNRVRGSVSSKFLHPIMNMFQIFQHIVTLLSVIGYLISVHWIFAVLCIVVFIPLTITQLKLSKNRYLVSYLQSRDSREIGYIANLFSDKASIKEIKIFNLSNHLNERWSQRFRIVSGQILTLARKQQWIDFGLQTGTTLFFTGISFFILFGKNSKVTQVGDFYTITQMIQNVQNSFTQLSYLTGSIYEETLYIQDFYEFIEYGDPAFAEAAAAAAAESPPTAAVQFQDSIEFDSVSYRYVNSDAEALKDVSFQIKKGEKIAIVGTNGSGKTTLIKCLLGLYPIREGNITIDGVSLHEVSPQNLQELMTVVFQDFTKYAFSAHDNIAFGDIQKYRDRELLVAAAEKSGVHQFVQHFADGYDTALGRLLADGEELSGGQWQKIAFARALFRDSEIMILDEPTAALDPYAEMEIYKEFEKLTRNRTTIFISHRMAAAKLADRIVVMQAGKVAEVGTHQELIERNGVYREMFELQAEWYR
ncbi:hypothetical protein CBW65_06080 [Tumebacillus avium]|uniref:ABC transporter ATP-binding protein n=1 Tax=Tumebacillus avium TaxID=1903704 RepID=A0A1Y0IK93_9BACL|nr:ABC transporter ATP-binding protein [Tumebacillus avium]ARU60700.1 hypothetical protein CBW65_06080 [Tumebacillus avium]